MCHDSVMAWQRTADKSVLCHSVLLHADVAITQVIRGHACVPQLCLAVHLCLIYALSCGYSGESG